jgi:3-oxoacyl-[acyl-carrier protein] reductase
MTTKPLLIIHGITGGIGRALFEEATSLLDYNPVFATERSDMLITDPKSVARFYANLTGIDPRGGGSIHVINATGVCIPGLLAKTSDEDYEAQRSVLLDGNFYLVREFLKNTKDRPGSSLLLLSSVVKRRRLAGTGVYAAMKAALDGLVQVAAAEAAFKGNRVNAIEMGYFNTGMINLVPKDEVKRLAASGQLGKVEDLWTACLEVLNNSFVNGSILAVTGGL